MKPVLIETVKSFSSEEEARRCLTQLVKLLRDSGFHLTKFVSNCSVAEYVQGADQRSNSTLVHALGVPWDTLADCFQYSLNLARKECTVEDFCQ